MIGAPPFCGQGARRQPLRNLHDRRRGAESGHPRRRKVVGSRPGNDTVQDREVVPRRIAGRDGDRYLIDQAASVDVRGHRQHPGADAAVELDRQRVNDRQGVVGRQPRSYAANHVDEGSKQDGEAIVAAFVGIIGDGAGALVREPPSRALIRRNCPQFPTEQLQTAGGVGSIRSSNKAFDDGLDVPCGSPRSLIQEHIG